MRSTDQNRSKKGPRKIGNTVQSSAKLWWAFTFNNYDKESIDYLCIVFNRIKCQYVFGEELGEENKTPHLQGQIKLCTKQRLSWLTKIDPRIHWSETRHLSASVDYCQKDGTVHTNMKLEKWVNPYVGVVWKPWQSDILKLVQSTPDSRSVHWFWESTGNVGKSFLTKYLIMRFNALVVSGKATDIFHQIAKREDEGLSTTIAVLDIPRTQLGFLSYQAIESLKNGYINSGKYEGGQYITDPVHVICFANEPPQFDMMSRDRWRVREITCQGGDARGSAPSVSDSLGAAPPTQRSSPLPVPNSRFTGC